MKTYPNYFSKPFEKKIYDRIPKRVWAALAKDFAIQAIGEDMHEKDLEAWAECCEDHYQAIRYAKLD